VAYSWTLSSVPNCETPEKDSTYLSARPSYVQAVLPRWWGDLGGFGENPAHPKPLEVACPG
jgi:hypothetical protein